jgi:hypothetical protein
MSRDAPGHLKNLGKIFKGNGAGREAPMGSSCQENTLKFAVPES